MPAAPLKLFREVGSFFSSFAMVFSGNIIELLTQWRSGWRLPLNQQLHL